MKINEAGRSMIEMLGVLAIIGVLSVGGIAGYTKAMNKYRINKVVDQVTMIVTNIRTLYAMQRDYENLDNTVAFNVGVIPDDMGSSATDVKNAFDGDVTIAASGKVTASDNKAFTVVFAGLTKEACVALATGDWGTGHSAGLISVGAAASSANTVGGTLLNADGSCSTTIGAGSSCYDSLPMPVATASTNCGCAAGSNACSVGWKYF